MGEVHDVILIHHELKEYPKRNVGMLLPIGLYLHKGIQEAQTGDIITTADGQTVKLVYKVELNIESRIADALSWQIYNRPMKYIAAKMHENWGDEMDEEFVLFVVVKWINSK